jgi:phage pi2 protein 07
MEVIVIDSKAYLKLQEELFQFLERKFAEMQANQLKQKNMEDWISVKETMLLLPVGRTKLQQLKNDGLIHFTQHKKKLQFSRKSIESFKKKHSTL